tara:strand:- start:2469 stop:2885 length:417 start_codon:yes stop_codon:yes gene_type:complete
MFYEKIDKQGELEVFYPVGRNKDMDFIDEKLQSLSFEEEELLDFNKKNSENKEFSVKLDCITNSDDELYVDISPYILSHNKPLEILNGINAVIYSNEKKIQTIPVSSRKSTLFITEFEKIPRGKITVELKKVNPNGNS